jgi:two-component system sensor histidine kinase/response regulator
MTDPASVSPSATPSSASGGQPAATSPTALARYGVAVGVVVLAFVLRWGLFGHLDNRLPFTFFLPAAMIAAWYGGMGPGLLAAGAGLLLGDLFFLPPHSALGPLGDVERTSITVYALTSTLAVMLIESLHMRIRRLERMWKQRQAAAPDKADYPPMP